MSLYIFDKEFDRKTLMGLEFDSAVMKTWLSFEARHVGTNPEPVLIFRDKSLCTTSGDIVRSLDSDLLVVFQINNGRDAIRIANFATWHSDQLKDDLQAIFNFPVITFKFEREYYMDVDSSAPIGFERSEITIPTSVLSVFVMPAKNFEGSWDEEFRKNGHPPAENVDVITYLDMVKDPRDKTLKDIDPNK